MHRQEENQAREHRHGRAVMRHPGDREPHAHDKPIEPRVALERVRETLRREQDREGQRHVRQSQHAEAAHQRQAHRQHTGLPPRHVASVPARDRAHLKRNQRPDEQERQAHGKETMAQDDFGGTDQPCRQGRKIAVTPGRREAFLPVEGLVTERRQDACDDRTRDEGRDEQDEEHTSPGALGRR
ncbi:hypothetical protein KCV01_g21706, partial [Aureobasidium melanogenum]